ncbi:MAG: leucine-rich repeat protein [Treponema sp.]|nr:leucine-rich repeat protein [Treponema sp.]
MTISKSWFSYLTRAFALSLCTALLLNIVSCSDSSTSQDPKVKIILDANGGSFSEPTGTTDTTQTLLIKKNQTSKLPTADELNLSCSNHNFTGWAKSQQGQVEYDDGADITSSTDLTLYAQWEAVNSTYTVKHLLQNLADDSYTEDEEATEQKTGTYGTQTTAAAKSYEGFTAQTFEQATIQADGQTVIEIYYDRNTYTISYSSTYVEPPASKPVKYGYVLTTDDLPDLKHADYSFKGWLLDGASIPEGYKVKTDIKLTALWDEIIATYTVKHLLQNLQDNNYTEDEEAAEPKSGKSGTQTAAAAKTYEGFTAKSFAQATIQADGSTVVEIKYDRNTYTVSYSSEYGEPPVSKTVRYGYQLTAADLPDLTQTNYSFKGWRLDGASIEAGYTVKKDMNLTAQWDEIIANYTVKHLLQNLKDDNYTEEAAEQKSGKSGTQTVAAAKSYEGFTAKSFVQATIQADGQTVVEIYYDRNTYTISYSSTYGEPPTSKTVKYGYVLTTADLPVLPDTILSFNGWRLEGASIEAGYTVKTAINLTAHWKAPPSVTKENFSAVIAALTENSTIVVTGELSESDLTAIATAIKKSSYKVNLDLSQTTGLTSIPDSTFRDCSKLSGISIPDSVTTIGKAAFFGCTSLTSITVDSNNANYSSIDGVLFNKDATAIITYPAGKQSDSYTIPDSVTSISDQAFLFCTSLASVTIGNSVTSIGDSAFYGCDSLSSVTIPDSVTSIGGSAFYFCKSLSSVIISDSVTTIGEGAFASCKSLTSVTIPDSVTTIGSTTFSGCTSLSSVTIPDSVTSIGTRAFEYCTSLSSVTIPDSVTSIVNYTFKECTSLSSVTIPDSVTSIGYASFSYCTSLTTITVDSNNAYYSSIDGVLFNKAATTIITYPEGKQSAAYTIPDSVTSIGQYAFYQPSALSSVTIPDSVTYIGDYAFYFCKSLSSVTIPDSVTSIVDHTFCNCTSLSSVTIGNSVTSISSSAFYDCSKLTSLTFKDPTTWYRTNSYGNWKNKTGGTLTDLSDAAANATYFKNTYKNYYWYKLDE